MNESEEARSRLEEARLGMQRAQQEVLFWQERIRVLEALAKEERPVILAPILEEAIKAIEWREKDPHFAWAFVRDKQGNEIQGVLPLVKAIESSSKGKLQVGGFEFSLSKNRMFLQRRSLK